jgi:hypothetical protein
MRNVNRTRQIISSAALAICTGDRDGAPFGVVCVIAIRVVLAASDAEPILGGFDKLDVKAPLVRPRKDAE